MPFHFHRVPLRVAHFILYVYCTKCPLLAKNPKLQFARVTCHLQSLSSRLKLENSVGIIISPIIMAKNTERANTCNSMAARRAIYSGHMKAILQFRIYLGVRTCDIFSSFRYLMLGFGYCLMISWLFCFLCSTSPLSLTGSYIEDEP